TVHTLWLLECWQRRSGRYVRGWLERLSEMEALAALATLTFDNPDWTFPEIVEGETPLLTARALAHPLLPPEVRVANDVTVGPPGSFLLVTGSNMSGKSTLLRAIGMNVVLAQAGGPVCAASLRMPPLALATSMRVRDSLERGVSYFMAELQRIKDVVDAAQVAHDAGQFTPLFLLDEILHGTNTTERQIAVRRIIPHLLALGAIGAVSTHDLQLAQTPEIAGVAHEAHFTETFHRGEDGPVMRFDYHLRPGIATTTNALKLMEIVGLPVGEP
ncbi:MAG: MutS family DNA mismatch repair protein, partial [Ktedonobacterales bacterium]